MRQGEIVSAGTLGSKPAGGPSGAGAIIGMKPWSRPDNLLTALMLTAGFAVGAWLALQTGRVFFYQTLMPSTVVAACGLGWFEPAAMPPALWNFLIMAAPSFDCAMLDGVPLEAGIGDGTRFHLYMAWVASWLWRILGLEVVNLWPLAAVLAGFYAAGCFVLARLFLPRIAACLVGMLVIVSPLANSVLETSLRDYAKAPFLIWALVLVVLAMRTRISRALLCIAAGLGAIIGIGTGFRSDLPSMIPIALIVLTLGQWGGPVPLKARIVAATLLLVLSTGLMAPLRANVQGFFGGIWMQGATEPFRYRLRLAPAPYDLGDRYSDELTYSSIAADMRRRDAATYDQNEGRPTRRTQALMQATAYAADWAPAFVGDVTIRALAAAWLTVGLPTLLNPATPRVQLYDTIYPGRFSLTQATAQGMTLIASRWTPVVGLVGLLAFLLRIYVRSPREALWLGVMLFLLLCLPSLQFAVRHLFHMEVFFWIWILSLPVAAASWSRLRPHVPVFLAWCAGCAAAGALGLALLVFGQNQMLRERISSLLAAPQHKLDMAPEARAEGRVLLRIAVPSAYRDVVDGPFDSAVPAAGHVNFNTVRASADRLIVEFGGPACTTQRLPFRISYALRSEVWQAKTRERVLQRPEGGWAEPVRVIMPAFYRASQHFEGIELEAIHQPCVLSIRRVEDDRRLPVIFSMIVAPGWQDRPLRLRFLGSLGPTPPR